MKRFILIASFVALALVNTANLQAQSRGVQAGVLRNDTTIPITYQMKLNNGDWRSFTLYPGKTHVNTLPTTPGNHTIHIRYDGRIGDDRITMVNTTLLTLGCQNAADGWMQRFILVNDGNDLVIAR